MTDLQVIQGSKNTRQTMWTMPIYQTITIDQKWHRANGLRHSFIVRNTTRPFTPELNVYCHTVCVFIYRFIFFYVSHPCFTRTEQIFRLSLKDCSDYKRKLDRSRRYNVIPNQCQWFMDINKYNSQSHLLFWSSCRLDFVRRCAILCQ